MFVNIILMLVIFLLILSNVAAHEWWYKRLQMEKQRHYAELHAQSKQKRHTKLAILLYRGEYFVVLADNEHITPEQVIEYLLQKLESHIISIK